MKDRLELVWALIALCLLGFLVTYASFLLDGPFERGIDDGVGVGQLFIFAGLSLTSASFLRGQYENLKSDLEKVLFGQSNAADTTPEAERHVLSLASASKVIAEAKTRSEAVTALAQDKNIAKTLEANQSDIKDYIAFKRSAAQFINAFYVFVATGIFVFLFEGVGDGGVFVDIPVQDRNYVQHLTLEYAPIIPQIIAQMEVYGVIIGILAGLYFLISGTLAFKERGITVARKTGPIQAITLEAVVNKKRELENKKSD
jgi:hypothetical protein